MTNADDSELAAKALRGDRTAFGLLLERHYDTVYRVAVRFTGSPEDGEDIAQDVCMSLVKKLRSFRGKSKFSTWLYSVAVNACRDHLRKQKSAEALQSNYAMFRSMDADNQADDAERLGWLSEAVAGLEPKLRETAILVLSEDLSHGQAAVALGCAETTVSWRMHEVRKKLKAMLESADD